MKMDGYDIGIKKRNGFISATYKVYTLKGGKHYRYGYKSYSAMIARHPELTDRKI